MGGKKKKGGKKGKKGKKKVAGEGDEETKNENDELKVVLPTFGWIKITVSTVACSVVSQSISVHHLSRLVHCVNLLLLLLCFGYHR